MNCLCGHFEWCELCTPKPDPPGTKRDFGSSVTVDLSPSEEELAAARRLKQAIRAMRYADFERMVAMLKTKP